MVPMTVPMIRNATQTGATWNSLEIIESAGTRSGPITFTINFSVVSLRCKIDRFLENKKSNDELLDSISAMHTLFEHIALVQILLRDTAEQDESGGTP